MLFSFTTTSVFANEITYSLDSIKLNTIEQFDEITDINTLKDMGRANGNVKTTTTSIENVKSLRSIDVVESGMVNITEIEVTQLLSKQQNGNGDIVENFVTNCIQEITPFATGTGSASSSESDSALSCTISLNIYFSKTDVYTSTGNWEVRSLTSVSGGVTAPSPSRISITAADLTLGQSGKKPGTSLGITITQTRDYNYFGSGIGASGGTFSMTPPSSWEPVITNSGPIGANLTIKFKMASPSTETWSNTVSCYASEYN